MWKPVKLYEGELSLFLFLCFVEKGGALMLTDSDLILLL